MNLQQLRQMRARCFLIGMSELVEAFDAMLPFFPRDESVETDAEKQVRAVLENMHLSVLTVEWLDEDELFEIEFTFFITRHELLIAFNVSDVDACTAWVTPKWRIVK